MEPIKITIWNEHWHEHRIPERMKHYPDGLHGAIAKAFENDPRFTVHMALMGEPEQGLPDALLDDTDVLIWWGHCRHDYVEEHIVAKVVSRVLEGMGLICLHASLKCKPLKRLLGTSCTMKWRVAEDSERVWVIEPSHPIARGLPESFTLEHEEMYGERIDLPRPDELVFISWYTGGEVGRTGCVWYRGNGRVFYFQPGHETFDSLNNKYVHRVLCNAAEWAANKHA